MQSDPPVSEKTSKTCVYKNIRTMRKYTTLFMVIQAKIRRRCTFSTLLFCFVRRKCVRKQPVHRETESAQLRAGACLLRKSSSGKSAVMLFRPSATVEALCSIAEVPGVISPIIPSRISAVLNPTIVL